MKEFAACLFQSKHSHVAMASTMTMIMTTMLLFVLHVAPVWEVITMASGDKAVLTAVRATVVNKGNFPVIKCYPGTTTNDPIRCDSSGRVTVIYLGGRDFKG